jgi:glycosyltransferase involved in cell wall biosynthesis
MIERKGVDLLLLAFDRLVSRGLDARLLLVGREADLPKFLAKVSPGTRSRVCYEGFQPPERLAEYFGKSDVFVLPSRHDGWGVVINQALAAGLPIITSNAVGAGIDLVENGVNGMRIAADDVDSLYRSMEALAWKPEVSRQWGERSREKARDLTPEAGAEKWVQVFDSLRARVH